MRSMRLTERWPKETTDIFDSITMRIVGDTVPQHTCIVFRTSTRLSKTMPRMASLPSVADQCECCSSEQDCEVQQIGNEIIRSY